MFTECGLSIMQNISKSPIENELDDMLLLPLPSVAFKWNQWLVTSADNIQFFPLSLVSAENDTVNNLKGHLTCKSTYFLKYIGKITVKLQLKVLRYHVFSIISKIWEVTKNSFKVLQN